MLQIIERRYFATVKLMRKAHLLYGPTSLVTIRLEARARALKDLLDEFGSSAPTHYIGPK